jgi:hypothetical protein
MLKTIHPSFLDRKILESCFHKVVAAMSHSLLEGCDFKKDFNYFLSSVSEVHKAYEKLEANKHHRDVLLEELPSPIFMS